MNKTTATLRFSEMLLSLLRGKTSLIDALYILSGDNMEIQIKNSALALLAVMKKGKNLSDGLRLTENSSIRFEPMYHSLITAAEATGNIVHVLERIVYDMRRKESAKGNVQGILFYPCIIVAVAIIGTIALVTKGLPVFIEAGFLTSDVLSDSVTGIVFAGIILLAGGAILFYFYYRIFYFDLPEYTIFYILDFLLRSNIPLSQALSYCILSVNNSKYARAIVMIKNEVISGIPFSAAFEHTGIFSGFVTGWLAVADSNGNLTEICENIKDYYEQKDKKQRLAMSKFMEPAIIILTGIYIFIIMITVVLPVLTYAGGIL